MPGEVISGFGGGNIAASFRSLSRVSAETVDREKAQVDAAVERGRELVPVPELTRPTIGRLDRNSSEIQSTIERTRAAPELEDQVSILRQAIAGNVARSGGSVDIFA